ncbi:sterol desaturase family protein [Acuticoccus mangrovi]|uniref:Sterol desaturase family protein n=1 Tax=Acuticoccus mangrovi TaxID=2796142 RepID=A0A934MDA3_9HYPH|nr:sterol desaturase family protein [Acuticoccus mangrovi]MBJ3776127.1 sterol desaturase family protein [Acuticoccus mangrovi]
MALSHEAADTGPFRHTPFTIMGMSGLKPILLVSTGMAVLYTLLAIAWSGAPLMVLGVVAAGLFYWTFLEYLLHRWVLHWEPEDKRLKIVRKCFPSHRPHHNDPIKERINVKLQLKITVYLSLVYTVFMWLVGVPLAVSLALNAGVLLGYQAYEYVHVACHHLPMRNAWARTLKRHHAIHHHRDETVNYGVTTTIWDSVFRTTWKPQRPTT